MTKEQLATQLNGREYGDEITKEQCAAAEAAGLVVVFGYSDDNVEFRGAITDESGCGDGSSIYLNRAGILASHENLCECPFCGYTEAVKKAAEIVTVWDTDGYSWQYKTSIPHATFEIVEDGQKYCRGIVMELNALPSLLRRLVRHQRICSQK
jgi:ribosomal protein S27AE